MADSKHCKTLVWYNIINFESFAFWSVLLAQEWVVESELSLV